MDQTDLVAYDNFFIRYYSSMRSRSARFGPEHVFTKKDPKLKNVLNGADYNTDTGGEATIVRALTCFHRPQKNVGPSSQAVAHWLRKYAFSGQHDLEVLPI